ncbi:MAG: hypothetical protein ACYCPN_06725 [Thermoplasmata archaeon]
MSPVAYAESRFQWSFAIAAVTFLAAGLTVYFAREVLGGPLRRSAVAPEAVLTGRPEGESIGSTTTD